MGLNLTKIIEYTGKHYITNNLDPVNNIEKIDSNAPYVLSSGIHIGTIDMNRWQTTLDAYRGIGLNRYGIYGVAEEDNTATPKFLLTADYIQDYGWGSAVPGEFRVGDNVREEAGFLVGKNWLWYTPIKGLNISGPLLRTISSDTNIIQSPSFDNITEFELNNVQWEPSNGYGGGACILFDQTGSLVIKGSKTIDGAIVIRGSIMYKNTLNFPTDAPIFVQADIFDLAGNLIAISTSVINPHEVEDWKRHNYILRLGPHENADNFRISLRVDNLPIGSSHNVRFDAWNAYRVFQSGIDAADLIESLPADGKSVIYDIQGIRAYKEDSQGNPELTFKLSAATGDAFFAGNMKVRGYVHSGPVYINCDPNDPYNPTYHHEIIGCGINTYAIYGIAPNTINQGYYNVGRSKFLLAAQSVQFNNDCDKWYWGEKMFAGELRVGNGLYYSQDKHDLFNPLTPENIYQHTPTQDYLWFYPGDSTLGPSDHRAYPFLRIRGSMLVNGYVHSGPIYREDLANPTNPPIIGGCGINQYAIYGIKTVGSGTDTDPYKVGESRFLISNQTYTFNTPDPYWGDQIFEGELRVGLNIIYDNTTDCLTDAQGNEATNYMWFRPQPSGSLLSSKFEIKGVIHATPGSNIPIDAIPEIGDPDNILNNLQKWNDINLTNVTQFLDHTQGNPIKRGLVAHDYYLGFYEPTVGGNLYSWRFKVDNTGKTFIGKYSETADRRFLYWDGSNLRIEGGLFAYKGFFKDLLYVGDESQGIEIYGGDHATTKQSSMFIKDPITNADISTPYIRSVHVKEGFNEGGWIILEDGTASYSKINGIGENIHVTTDHYWVEHTSGGETTWTREKRASYTGFLATYESIPGTAYLPACAIYMHDPPAQVGHCDIANYTYGYGCFRNTDGSHKLSIYNSATTNRCRDLMLRTDYITSIKWATSKSTWTTGDQGLYLQESPNEPIGFYGSEPKLRPHLKLKGYLWNEGTTDSKLNYLADCLTQLFKKLGELDDPDDGTIISGLGLFSWEWLQNAP